MGISYNNIIKMEPLKDACNDRVVKNVPRPPHDKLTSTLLFPNGRDKPGD